MNQIIDGPDFIGVGAAKSGTTWWYELLNEHPQIVKPYGSIKQASFFNRFEKEIPEKELTNYRGLFNHDKDFVCGEWTPRYMYDHYSMSLIYRYFPEAKIFIILRNPLHRLRSGINWHLIESGPGKFPNLEAYYDSDTCHHWPINIGDAIARSMYWTQLRQIKYLFPQENIHLMQFEKCLINTTENLKECFQFLGVDPDFQVKNSKYPKNVSNYVYDIMDDPLLVNGMINILRSDVEKLANDWQEIELELWPEFADL